MASTWDTFKSIICERKAIREYLDRPVSKTDLVHILEVAARAPSNSNTQPWRTFILSGEKRKALSEDIWNAHMYSSDKHTPQYKHFPDSLDEQYTKRQADFGARYYGALKIGMADQEARHKQTGQNFLFFGAPIGLIFTIESSLEKGSWIDYGIYLQSLMLAAKAKGLDTCPQISFAKYHEIIRRHIPVESSQMVVCGMSLGYRNPSAPVNNLNIPREETSRFASFIGFDDDSDV